MTNEQKTIRRFIQAGINGLKHTKGPVSADELRFFGEAVTAMRRHPSLYGGFPSVDEVESKWFELRRTMLDDPATYPMTYSTLKLLGEMLES